ncbi:cytochrome P450 2C23-like isoform X2 [Watersipora subatra]|uniref:cytochrome P450 2C23-like isoform X2 n=1 Tax=Watersipora subatra TaxID=2589382 RepID=UPI00355C3CB7
MEREEILTQGLLVAVVLLMSYLLIKSLKNPLRKIPGPSGYPLLGNILSLNPKNIHNQFYEMARKYGDVMKVKIFTKPIVVLNSRQACLEALIKTGTDFQGRPPLKRNNMVVPTNVVFSNFSDEQAMLRRLFTKAMKAYGPGVAHLENVMQDTIRGLVDDIDQKGDQAIDSTELSIGYVCCVLASMMFGEKYSYDDELCHQMNQVNSQVIEATDPFSGGAVLDAMPFLYDFKFLFRDQHKKLDSANEAVTNFIHSRIEDAKKSFDANQMRGCLDYFIELQQREIGADGKPLLDEVMLRGLMVNFLTAGLETSRRSLAQIFLDLLHDPTLQKTLQAEIDSQFEPTETITLKDKVKLPRMEAYMLEQMRFLTQVPFMIPHMAVRDAEVAGYKIPAGTVVLMNSYHVAHNPDVFDEPFEVKPDRLIDESGKLVDRDHPLRENFLGFGAGRRQCPGESFAKSRIFLFLANILQKYDVKVDGELPERDVRKYPMSILLTPPSVKVQFTRRQ